MSMRFSALFQTVWDGIRKIEDYREALEKYGPALEEMWCFYQEDKEHEIKENKISKNLQKQYDSANRISIIDENGLKTLAYNKEVRTYMHDYFCSEKVYIPEREDEPCRLLLHDQVCPCWNICSTWFSVSDDDEKYEEWFRMLNDSGFLIPLITNILQDQPDFFKGVLDCDIQVIIKSLLKE